MRLLLIGTAGLYRSACWRRPLLVSRHRSSWESLAQCLLARNHRTHCLLGDSSITIKYSRQLTLSSYVTRKLAIEAITIISVVVLISLSASISVVPILSSFIASPALR